ncbi:MAG: hypothetical protein EA406_11790 [Rhodospirillales bacterium]|nr:MAG: hypothetical protein EA406_11790 [Rhodospirillales bacterium]
MTSAACPIDGAAPVLIGTSAMLAIVLLEEEASRFLDAIAAAEARLISPAVMLETWIVTEARRGGRRRWA